MGFLRDTVLAFFEGDGWELIDTGDGYTWLTGVAGDNGRWSVVVQVHEKQAVVAIYSVAATDAPLDRFAATIEYLTRANAGMATGNFEFDYDDGGVRYKTSIDVEGLSEDVLAQDDLLTHFLRGLVYMNVGTFDRYLPGLDAVIEDRASPAGAIAMVES